MKLKLVAPEGLVTESVEAENAASFEEHCPVVLGVSRVGDRAGGLFGARCRHRADGSVDHEEREIQQRAATENDGTKAHAPLDERDHGLHLR